MSGLFKLNLNDLIKGLTTAVVAGVIFALAGIVGGANFNLFTADWTSILTTALNAAFAAGVGYLGKNLLSDQNGAVLGRWGGN